MNGNVSQLYFEQRFKNQSKSTIDTLKMFASRKYTSHTKYLTPLFTDLEKPKLYKPVLKNLESETVTLADGTKRERERVVFGLRPSA